MRRILLFADVDLNLIDGSSTWLVALAELLAGSPEVAVEVLQRTRLERDVVVRDARALPNVSFVDPWAMAERDPTLAAALGSHAAPRLHPEAAAALILRLDEGRAYTRVVVRSPETALLLVGRPELRGRLWPYVTDPRRHVSDADRAKLRAIHDGCDRFLCQTEEARDEFVRLLGIGDAGRLVVLPPMVPGADPRDPPALDPRAPRLGYSGKLSPAYRILETLDAFDQIRACIPGAEFHVVGDKIHNAPPVPGFAGAVQRRLSGTPGVVWHGGVSRAEAHEILGGVHLACSWRDESFDDSLEMSTKVLEYASLGTPVLMNPSRVQRRVFGAEYPGYVRTEREFVDRFLELVSSAELYAAASEHVRRVAADFSYGATLRRLLPLLREPARPKVVGRPRARVLFAGHDFKFLRPLLSHLGDRESFEVLRDEYTGHVVRDPSRSESLLRHADLLFCEWCLGNAEWYSSRKRDDQRLVVRFHRQELETGFPERVRWEKVDRVLFICPAVRDRFLASFPEVAERTQLVYNFVEADHLDRPKWEGAEFNLGLLGYCPKLKAPHLALEILERLRAADRRYTLSVKGKSPRDLDWLWRRPEEREYYERFHDALDRSPCADAVVFDPHGDDVAEWFPRIGFLLSTSDLEGSHQAVAEGMASGSIPVVRNWAGADALYPARYVFRTVDEAVERILGWRTESRYLEESRACREYVRARFDRPVIARQYDELFEGLLEVAA